MVYFKMCPTNEMFQNNQSQKIVCNTLVVDHFLHTKLQHWINLNRGKLSTKNEENNSKIFNFLFQSFFYNGKIA